MSINWNDIRPLNNSLNDGFEELVCQLAEQENVNNKNKFIRIGKPDGGKECYWELEDGSLLMWQAKYFTSSLHQTQWTQIDKSIYKAIDCHSNLSKYYVCLPLDRPDAKVLGQKSMLEKWKQKVNEWKIYSQTKLGRKIEIEYWGSFELLQRLSKKTNEGLMYFWFNHEEFSDDWFEYKNKESIDALGVRYSKELNLELPIAKIFDGLSRDRDFVIQHHLLYRKMLNSYNKVRTINVDDFIKISIDKLDNEILSFKILFKSIDFINNEPILYDKLNEPLTKMYTISSGIYDKLLELRKEINVEEKANFYNITYRNEISIIQNFQNILDELQFFYNGIICNLSNNPFLIIWGKAGCGKSHLLADIVNKRKNNNQQSLLILGEHFSTHELPWRQILCNFLRNQNIDELTFLGALNAKAASDRKRIIIFIDALNEGKGREIWPNNLKSFINSIKKYPWLGLVVTIRDSYLKLIASEEKLDLSFIQRIEHKGFAGNEYDAVKLFFRYYKIMLPSTPLLNPEFYNPLFLKLYCLSLFERGLHEVPLGYEGITVIINSFLFSVNHKLSRPDNLYFDENIDLVKQSVDSLVLYMINNNTDHVPYLEANKIVNEIFKDQCSKKEPYLIRLLSEGVFNKNLYWDNNGESYEAIYLAYQRFQDHLTIALLLDKYLNTSNPISSFKSGVLYSLIKDFEALINNQNLIEALSVQLPERVNKELFEFIPNEIKDSYLIATAFIQSLLWRDIPTITEEVKSFINEVIIREENLFDYFFETIISISMKPNFYYNAETIHSFLVQFSLSERDSMWTIWLQGKYNKEKYNISSIQRLVDWAWDEKVSYLSNDTIYLASITLSWFLVSTNRYLRDATTKALICILKDRIHLLPILLNKFKGVNDPYVLERLYAVSYGCVLRSTDADNIKELCKFIYHEVFSNEIVYPHILLRDYARGIIEYALHLKIIINIDTNKIRPPYKSKKIPLRFPSNKYIEKKYMPKGEDAYYTGRCWGANAIIRSMTTEYGKGIGNYGDFGRYVFQRAFEHWQVNCNGLSNYAVKCIFELGYEPDLFSEFDKSQGSGRHSGHNERIGKKYQWIVYYELLARVSDQYLLMDESDFNYPKSSLLYQGPWYPYVRDIDPTILIKEKESERIEQFLHQWWFNSQYNFGALSQREWIKSKNDIPNPENIIEVTDSLGEKWIWLNFHPEWKDKTPIGEYDTLESYRRLWMDIQSYILPKTDINKLKANYSKIDRFPNSRSLFEIFSREYYWSSAFIFHNKPYYDGQDWMDLTINRYEETIVKIHRLTEFFNWENVYDYSKELPIQYYYPTQILFQGLKLKYSSKDAEFIDETGQLICFDPSVSNQSPNGFLIRKAPLLEWLNKNDYALVWNVYGEKQIIGNNICSEERIGLLDISGLYFLNENMDIAGKLNFIDR